MHKIIFVICLIFIMNCAHAKGKILEAGEVEHFAYTQDDIRIAYDAYLYSHDAALIIAPGWFMTKDSYQFKSLSHDLSQYFDVFCMDFRGHGRSGGRYTFSSNEVKDLRAVVQSVKKQGYKKIYLMGFSLGGSVSILYCAQYDDIDKLVTISAPEEFGKIENNMWKKEAFVPTFQKWLINRKFQKYPKNIRMGNLFAQKIAPIKVISKINIPKLFLCGDCDPTVSSKHTKSLFEEAKGLKEIEVFQNCFHAEDLYIQKKELFMDTCVNWLLK